MKLRGVMLLRICPNSKKQVLNELLYQCFVGNALSTCNTFVNTELIDTCDDSFSVISKRELYIQWNYSEFK